jgi:hypothetical protein
MYLLIQIMLQEFLSDVYVETKFFYQSNFTIFHHVLFLFLFFTRKNEKKLKYMTWTCMLKSSLSPF